MMETIRPASNEGNRFAKTVDGSPSSSNEGGGDGGRHSLPPLATQVPRTSGAGATIISSKNNVNLVSSPVRQNPRRSSLGSKVGSVVAALSTSPSSSTTEKNDKTLSSPSRKKKWIPRKSNEHLLPPAFRSANQHFSPSRPRLNSGEGTTASMAMSRSLKSNITAPLLHDHNLHDSGSTLDTSKHAEQQNNNNTGPNRKPKPPSKLNKNKWPPKTKKDLALLEQSKRRAAELQNMESIVKSRRSSFEPKLEPSSSIDSKEASSTTTETKKMSPKNTISPEEAKSNIAAVISKDQDAKDGIFQVESFDADVNDEDSFDLNLPSGQVLPPPRKKYKRTNFRIRYKGPTLLPIEEIFGTEEPYETFDRFASGSRTSASDSMPANPRRGSFGRGDGGSGGMDMAPVVPKRYIDPYWSDDEEIEYLSDGSSDIDDDDDDSDNGSLSESSLDRKRSASTNNKEKTDLPPTRPASSECRHHNRPDVWITPIPNTNPREWNVRRVWNLDGIDEQEQDHVVEEKYLLEHIRKLCGVPQDNKESNEALWKVKKIFDIDGEIVSDEVESRISKDAMMGDFKLCSDKMTKYEKEEEEKQKNNDITTAPSQDSHTSNSVDEVDENNNIVAAVATTQVNNDLSQSDNGITPNVENNSDTAASTTTPTNRLKETMSNEQEEQGKNIENAGEVKPPSNDELGKTEKKKKKKKGKKKKEEPESSIYDLFNPAPMVTLQWKDALG